MHALESYVVFFFSLSIYDIQLSVTLSVVPEQLTVINTQKYEQ